MYLGPCVLCGSHNKERFSPCTSLTGWLLWWWSCCFLCPVNRFSSLPLFAKGKLGPFKITVSACPYLNFYTRSEEKTATLSCVTVKCTPTRWRLRWQSQHVVWWRWRIVWAGRVKLGCGVQLPLRTTTVGDFELTDRLAYRESWLWRCSCAWRTPCGTFLVKLVVLC